MFVHVCAHSLSLLFKYMVGSCHFLTNVAQDTLYEEKYENSFDFVYYSYSKIFLLISFDLVFPDLFRYFFGSFLIPIKILLNTDKTLFVSDFL